MAALEIGQNQRLFRVTHASLSALERSRIRVNLSSKLCGRGRSASTNFIISASVFSDSPNTLVSRRSTKAAAHQQYEILSRSAELINDYSHCKNNSIEGASMGIMADVIKHCFNDECEGMREKVFDQMGSGLAALFRVSMGVAADSVPTPVSNRRDLADITMEDLEQVRRLLQLTSLPFQNGSDDEDFQRVTDMLRHGKGQVRRLTGSELAIICERLSSDLVQCLGPLAMCFPKLPLYAQQRALLMPAEVAGKMAMSLIVGPDRRR